MAVSSFPAVDSRSTKGVPPDKFILTVLKLLKNPKNKVHAVIAFGADYEQFIKNFMK
jgi:hypothetical protein